MAAVIGSIIPLAVIDAWNLGFCVRNRVRQPACETSCILAKHELRTVAPATSSKYNTFDCDVRECTAAILEVVDIIHASVISFGRPVKRAVPSHAAVAYPVLQRTFRLYDCRSKSVAVKWERCGVGADSVKILG